MSFLPMLSAPQHATPTEGSASFDSNANTKPQVSAEGDLTWQRAMEQARQVNMGDWLTHSSPVVNVPARPNSERTHLDGGHEEDSASWQKGHQSDGNEAVQERNGLVGAAAPQDYSPTARQTVNAPDQLLDASSSGRLRPAEAAANATVVSASMFDEQRIGADMGGNSLPLRSEMVRELVWRMATATAQYPQAADAHDEARSDSAPTFPSHATPADPAFGRMTNGGTSSDTLRIHMEWSAQGAHVWLGTDASVNLSLPMLVRRMRQALTERGERLASVTCNGSLVWQEESAALFLDRSAGDEISSTRSST